MAEKSWLDTFDPADIDVQAVDGYHHGGRQFSASFELSDPRSENSRSYLIELQFDDNIQYRVRLQVEDRIWSHVSLSATEHFVLELGALVHHLTAAGDTMEELPNGILRRLWVQTPDRIFAIGDTGNSYVRTAGQWTELTPFGEVVMNDIHGLPDGPVYVCGDDGLLLRLDGQGWGRIDIGREHHFNAIWVDKKGSIFLAAGDGTCMQVVNEEEVIELQSEDFNYFDIMEFRGKRYWSDANFGASLQKKRRIDPLFETEQGFKMSASDQFLVMAGWHEFWLYDEKSWAGFEMGWNGEIFLSAIDPNDYGS